MKYAEMRAIDIRADVEDNVTVEWQRRPMEGGTNTVTLYVHVNGITVLRIGNIAENMFEVEVP